MSALLRAIGVLALGKLLFAIQDAIIKQMSGAFPMHEIMTIRGLTAVPILLLLIHFTLRPGELGRHHPGFHVLRGVLMFVAFMAFYVGLAEISLTTATALFFTAPLFITLLSVPLLGERVGPHRVGGIVAGFAGVVILLRPDAGEFDAVALLPVVAAFFYALCQILVRYAKLTAPPAVMSLYASLAFVVLAPVTGLVFAGFDPATAARPSANALTLPWTLPRGLDLALLVLTGLTSALGFMCTSNAYQRAEASRVAPFEYVMIVWVTLLAWLIWRELPDEATIAGILIIVLSGIYVLRHDERAADAAPVPPR